MRIAALALAVLLSACAAAPSASAVITLAVYGVGRLVFLRLSPRFADEV